MDDKDIDYYEILGVTDGVGDKELSRAYRLKALKYHPDKNKDNPGAVQLFHNLKEAYDLLSDSKQRAAYDEKRRSIVVKRQRLEAMNGQRKRMKAQLERDELMAKQQREHEKKEMHETARRFRDELRREETRRDKQMRQHMHTKDVEEEIEAADVDNDSEIDRSVRIKWDPTEIPGDSIIGRDTLLQIFGAFGELEEVVMAPSSTSIAHARRNGSCCSALLVYKSIVSANSLMNAQRKNTQQHSQLRPYKLYWAKSVLVTKHAPPNTPKTFAIPDVSQIRIGDEISRHRSFAEFEAYTLLCMRSSKQHSS